MLILSAESKSSLRHYCTTALRLSASQLIEHAANVQLDDDKPNDGILVRLCLVVMGWDTEQICIS